MASLKGLLRNTFPLQGVVEGEKDFLEGDSVETEDLKPVVIGDGTATEASKPVFLTNPCWSWKHDASSPATLKDIGCRVRGMGMNYIHPMPVCTSVSLIEASVTSEGKEFVLPLTKDFVMLKKYIKRGHVPALSSDLWKLESNLDQSLIVAFGYMVVDGDVKPLTLARAAFLNELFMPDSDGDIVVSGSAAEVTKVLVSKMRVLLVLSFGLCKERPDLAPGALLGTNRLFPHAMIMSSVDLERASVSFDVSRPGTTIHAGPIDTIPPDKPDEMLTKIKHILFTDTNISRSLLGDDIFGFPGFLPTWDSIFDYYDTDPLGSGNKTTFIAVDPSKDVRHSSSFVKHRGGPGNPLGSYFPRKIEKRRGQGEFDNMHIAPPMKMSKKLFLPPSLRTEEIAMAPICVHDCLHMHWRWGVLATETSQKGFDSQGLTGNPNSEIAAPMVPRNQKVTIHLVPPAGYVYEAEAKEGVNSKGDKIPIRAGKWTVFMHHGMAYANGIWSDSDLNLARDGVEAFSGVVGEDKFVTSATGSFALWYWRLRYGSQKDKLLERLRIDDLAGCRKL